MDPAAALRLAELARQRDFLCRLARGLLGDAARAEDVVQDAFVLALERPPHEPRALPAWLGRVVGRLSRNELRRAERARRHEGAAARPERQDSHAEAAASLDAQQFVLAAVRALEEPYRTTIWLRYHEELTPSAIAAREGLPVKTVKTRISRGLERLRAELDRSSGGDRAAWGALLLPLARHLAPGPVASEVLGGMLAMKKLAAVVIVLACAVLGARVVGSRSARLASDASPGPAPAEEVTAGGEPREVAVESAPRREALAAAGARAGREAASAGATLVVHASFERDGTDAAGIGLVALPLEEPRSDRRAARAETDGTGRARFEGLAAGVYALHTDRAGRAECQLQAGAAEELDLVIPAGVDVEGVVVDGAGRAIPGAEIWLSRVSRDVGYGWLAGAIVARAGADGAFFLRSVGPRQSVGAFARGFAPALVEELEEKSWTASDPRVRLTLVLDREGAVLEGRVLDAEGAPVPGAIVAFGGESQEELPRPDGRLGHGPTARAVESDELGRFRADWLEPGPISVFVLAEGHALARVVVTAASVCAEPLVVRLVRGATVLGSVHAATGGAVSGVEVSVLRARAIGYPPFRLPATRSSADGAFRLEHVPAGEDLLSARLASDPRLSARTTRSLADGATEAWDLVLEESPGITGRAVDGAGQGLAGWSIFAGSGGVGVGLETDSEGRFVFAVQDAAQAWTVELRHGGVLHDSAEGVRAGDALVLTGLGAEDLARVEGRFEDAGRRVPEGERVLARLVSEPAGTGPTTGVTDGSFAFEGASPGQYRVQVKTADRMLAESEPFDLASGATLDVGLLLSRPAGSLVVEFVAPEGTTLPEGCATVITAGGTRVLVRRDGTWRQEDLEPGRGWLITSFPGLGRESCSFQIEDGSETRLTVALERGVVRTLSFVPPPGMTCPGVDVTVRADSWEMALPAFGVERAEVTLTLAPGRYEVEAATSTGLVARGVLEIPDLLVESARVTFELR